MSFGLGISAGRWILGGLAALAGYGVYTSVNPTPDFMQAYMINRMSGRGGWARTVFVDGLKSLFMGSRTLSAMTSGGFGAAMMMNPMMMGMMNPMMMGGMMNPMMMGGMGGFGYNPMLMSRMMWGF